MGWEDKFRPRGGGSQPPPINIPEIKLPDIKLPPINSKMIIMALVVLLAIWGLSGFYKVGLSEQGVRLFFGKVAGISDPGLNWYFPGPIGEVIKVRVEEVKRVEIGFRSGLRRGRATTRDFQEESLMLTKSVNIIDVDMVVQYQVTDPVTFLFKTADVRRVLVDRGLEETVRHVAEAALREVVGRTEIDSLLTTEKSRVQIEINQQMQKILDHYETGITVGLVQFQDVHPPQEVKAAFKDVNNAEEDKNRLIREAEGYRNSVIPVTRGKAEQVINEALAYKQQRISRAQGDASRFLSQLEAYSRAKDITRKRMYIETMESVLANSQKFLLDGKTASKVLPILPFGRDLSSLGGGK